MTEASPERLLFRSHVLEIDRLLVDAAPWRRDVVGELARLVHRRRHDAQEVFGIFFRWEPFVFPALPRLGRNRHAVRVEVEPEIHADAAMELAVRQAQPLGHAIALEDAVPPLDARRAVADVPI